MRADIAEIMSGRKLLEWLVVVYDRPNVNRLLFRTQHIARIPLLVGKGIITNCGPIFSDDERSKFIGSSFNLRAASREDVVDFLKEDIYWKEGVWDVDNAIIHPYTAVRRVEEGEK